jgi:hypothetical protein
MKINILTSILNGNLRPAFNTNEGFDDLTVPALQKATQYIPKTTQDLYQQLSTLLRNFPELLQYLNEEKLTSSEILIPHLYQIDLPLHKNTHSHFYYLLYLQETLRVFNVAIIKYKHLEPVLQEYKVQMLLDSIKANTIRVSTELREQGGNGIPNAAENPVHYALYVAKYLMLILFMELQEVFSHAISEKITPKFFFQNLLKEEYNEKSLSPDVQYFENKLLLLINNGTSLQEDYLLLLRQYQQAQVNKDSIVSKIHNAIYSCDEGPAFFKYESLHDTVLVADAIEKKKRELSKSINSLAYGFERLEVVNMAISNLEYISEPDKHIQSIPAQLKSWLQNQQQVYLANASQVFATDGAATSPKIEKQQKPLEQKKQIVYEHLRFMKGTNLQDKPIMSEAEFDRMISYLYFLLQHDYLPEKIEPIPLVNLSSGFIRYTFYLLHQIVIGKGRVNESWIHFLHTCFGQFSAVDLKTTKTKFSQPPKSYESDLKQIRR